VSKRLHTPAGPFLPGKLLGFGHPIAKKRLKYLVNEGGTRCAGYFSVANGLHGPCNELAVISIRGGHSACRAAHNGSSGRIRTYQGFGLIITYRADEATRA
jgi:hypothetical protein